MLTGEQLSEATAVFRYMRQYFCLEAVTTDSFLLSKSSTYYIPEDTDIGGYRDYINVVLPGIDDSEAFGQHPNADISSQVCGQLCYLPTMGTCPGWGRDPEMVPAGVFMGQVEETNTLLDTIVSLQPAVATAAGETTEDKVGRIAADLAATVPEDINLEEAIKAKEDDQSALNVVLFQEIERYLILLNTIRRSLSDVQKVPTPLDEAALPPHGFGSSMGGWYRASRGLWSCPWTSRRSSIVYSMGRCS